jgi:hypothetical protein
MEFRRKCRKSYCILNPDALELVHILIPPTRYSGYHDGYLQGGLQNGSSVSSRYKAV